MTEIFTLSIEIQAALVAGFIAISIKNVGKQKRSNAGMITVEIFVFGFLAMHMSQYAISWITSSEALNPVSLDFWHIMTAALFGTILGMFWRKAGSNWLSKIMAVFGVYRDDHETSTINSIMALSANKLAWTMVHIHLKNGDTLEMDMEALPKNIPSDRLFQNDDGWAFYPTHLHRSDKTDTQIPASDDKYGFGLTYIKEDEISRVDIWWKQP
jgi:hypothetical protein